MTRAPGEPIEVRWDPPNPERRLKVPAQTQHECRVCGELAVRDFLCKTHLALVERLEEAAARS